MGFCTIHKPNYFEKHYNLMPPFSFLLIFFFRLRQRDLRRPVVADCATMDNGAIIYNRDPPGDSMLNEQVPQDNHLVNSASLWKASFSSTSWIALFVLCFTFRGSLHEAAFESPTYMRECRVRKKPSSFTQNSVAVGKILYDCEYHTRPIFCIVLLAQPTFFCKYQKIYNIFRMRV